MSIPILATKLYIPSPRSKFVQRSRLIERLHEGASHRLTLVSAPAGFGKTTLLGAWIADRAEPTAWLSLDEGDNDPARFLTYLIAALQTVAPEIGEGMLDSLQAPQPPSTTAILTTLLNEITARPDHFVLVLDDYHVIDTKPVEQAVTFLIEHLPPQMHLVIATREDPQVPLGRLRGRGQLTEIRATDLRFSLDEAADFLNEIMGFKLLPQDIEALEKRTEGWIVGLQLAAISMRGQPDITSFIQSFTGSHHFVLDYLLEEVLQQQPESVQTFLLHTAILDRLCGPLCDAVVGSTAGTGQETLEQLERANLFIIPIDQERKWYRYHHLFAQMLQQRLHQRLDTATEPASPSLSELHTRASIWYEDHGLEIAAFQHAAAANDLDRAERLIEGSGVPLHLRGTVNTVLAWLASLPASILHTRPALCWRYGSLLLANGQTTGVAEKLQAAETALQNVPLDDQTRDLIGRIAAARATLALTQYQVAGIVYQSQRALEYLAPTNLYLRFIAVWTMAFAYYLQGDRAATGKAYTEALAISQASGDTFSIILAASSLGQFQELENQLYVAFQTYQHALQLLGEHPQPSGCDAYLGMARLYYEWNDLDRAEQYGQQSLQLARQYDSVIDRFIICEVFLARLKLAQGDVAGATTILTEASQSARQHNFVHRMPEIAAAQIQLMLYQGNWEAAVQLAEGYELPLIQARLQLVQGKPTATLVILEPLRQKMEAMAWQDERLKVMILQALALYAQDEKEQAIEVLDEALRIAEAGGFVRTFIDEGSSMAALLSEAVAQGVMSEYARKLLTVFEPNVPTSEVPTSQPATQTNLLDEPLTARELEVLQLIAQGLSNQEISEKLFLALITVKVHNQKIFGKLQVKRRTEAVARARELGLIA